MAIDEEAFGKTHQATERDLLSLAGALQAAGRILEMTEALSKAADILEETIGASEFKTVSLRIQIAKFQIGLGPEQARKALDYLRHIQPIIARSAPPGHPVRQSSSELLHKAEAAAAG